MLLPALRVWGCERVVVVGSGRGKNDVERECRCRRSSCAVWWLMVVGVALLDSCSVSWLPARELRTDHSTLSSSFLSLCLSTRSACSYSLSQPYSTQSYTRTANYHGQSSLRSFVRSQTTIPSTHSTHYLRRRRQRPRQPPGVGRLAGTQGGLRTRMCVSRLFALSFFSFN